MDQWSLSMWKVVRYQHFPPYKYAEADKGYRGDCQIASPDEFDTNEENVLKIDVRARHETVNICCFEGKISTSYFKNDLSNHEVCFNYTLNLCIQSTDTIWFIMNCNLGL